MFKKHIFAPSMTYTHFLFTWVEINYGPKVNFKSINSSINCSYIWSIVCFQVILCLIGSCEGTGYNEPCNDNTMICDSSLGLQCGSDSLCICIMKTHYNTSSSCEPSNVFFSLLDLNNNSPLFDSQGRSHL